MHNNLGYILFRLGDLEGAEAHFRQVLLIRPGDPVARVNLEMVRILRNRTSPPGN